MLTNAILHAVTRLMARRSTDTDRGATMVEYGLLIGVVVVAILVGAVAFGNNISDWFSNTLSTRITSK